ncbi:hypothetical protein ABR737_05645 [Streptomyces sp. Edi2]|uniref:hypothetical protein n=1 Tax=Streptomyces sp. Edi2 TaxID=3162528 RepID=UPI0033066C8A
MFDELLAHDLMPEHHRLPASAGRDTAGRRQNRWASAGTSRTHWQWTYAWIPRCSCPTRSPGKPSHRDRAGPAHAIPHVTPAWQTYRHPFLEHYGPRVLVPLLECNDPVTAIDLPDGFHASTSAA